MTGGRAGRIDRAVVLARGASRRMGMPKGLCRLPGEPGTFIERIVDLYARMDIPAAVVTLPELRPAYEDLGLDPAPRWIEAGPGGGTAVTVMAAVAELGGVATHLWLHPVDLPLVRPRSLAGLARRSAADPGAVVVPRCEGRRGHPVVIPVGPFASLAGDASPAARGPMRDLIRAAADSGTGAPVLFLDLDDPGLVRDFDTPDALEGAGPDNREA